VSADATRAALPRRPPLGAVLDALAVPSAGDPLPSYWCNAAGVPLVVSDRGPVVAVGSPYHSVRYPWIDASPAEAYELLQARDLVPMGYVGRFVCEACGGTDYVPVDRVSGDSCPACDGGHRPHPPTVAALASWASLGWAAGDDGAPGILGAEELAAATSPDAPVCWRIAQPGADAAPAYRSGSPARQLLDAGFGWWRRPTHTALVVMPLGLVTP